jgi:hypothetical protein
MRHTFVFTLAVFALSLVASPAAAFGDPASFAAAVTDGGGGGKFFTGSRAEGYTCRVCHSAGTPPSLALSGLPVDGYVPGATYRIGIDWPDDLPSVGLNAEATDFDAVPFGQLMAADPMQLTPADLCSGTTAPSSGQTLVDALGRRVLLVAACGQAQTTLTWQAPNTPERGLLSGSIVVSNRDASVGGDTVFDFSFPLSAQSDALPLVNRYLGGCAVHAPASSGVAPCAALLLGWFVLRRVRDRRRVARSCSTDAVAATFADQTDRLAIAAATSASRTAPFRAAAPTLSDRPDSLRAKPAHSAGRPRSYSAAAQVSDRLNSQTGVPAPPPRRKP